MTTSAQRSNHHRHSSLRRALVTALSLAAIGATGGTALHAQTTARTAPAHHAKPTIVLVHGAFADGTGWQHVIPILQGKGYTVLAVQNSLASFADDVQTTQRVFDAQTDPVVAVGHSYGGAVITGAAAGRANVKALVYIAAFAPEANEAIAAFGEKYPTALGPALRADSAGFLTIDRARFRELFAQDVSAKEASIMAAAQKPIFGDSFSASLPNPAWKTIPSWYLVTQQDGALNPDLQRFYAKRMGAKTSEIRSSHVPFVSRPQVVARLIDEAARAGTQ
jgi:pimeloyl-ACP methyl ester carboxylesterase